MCIVFVYVLHLYVSCVLGISILKMLVPQRQKKKHEFVTLCDVFVIHGVDSELSLVLVSPIRSAAN